MSARMHIPAEPAGRNRPGMSADRITAARQIVDTEGSALEAALPIRYGGSDCA